MTATTGQQIRRDDARWRADRRRAHRLRDLRHGGRVRRRICWSPANVAKRRRRRDVIAASADFQSERGFTADFTIPRNPPLPTGGMICWGGGGGAGAGEPADAGAGRTSRTTSTASRTATTAAAANALTGTPTTRAPLTTRHPRRHDQRQRERLSPAAIPRRPTTQAARSPSPASSRAPAATASPAATRTTTTRQPGRGRRCSSARDFEAYGSACATDGIECTDDVCNGAAACIHPPSSPFTSCTSDGIECTDDLCDGAGAAARTPRAADHAVHAGRQRLHGRPLRRRGRLRHDRQHRAVRRCEPVHRGRHLRGRRVQSATRRRASSAPPLAAGKSILLCQEQFPTTRRTRLGGRGRTHGPAALVGDPVTPVTSTDYALCVYDQSVRSALRRSAGAATSRTAAPAARSQAGPRSRRASRTPTRPGLERRPVERQAAGRATRASRRRAPPARRAVEAPALLFTGAVTAAVGGGRRLLERHVPTPLPQRDPTAQAAK